MNNAITSDEASAILMKFTLRSLSLRSTNSIRISFA